MCISGEPRRCVEAARLWMVGGEAAPPDYVKAVDFYQRACNARVPEACKDVAVLVQKLRDGCPVVDMTLGAAGAHPAGSCADLAHLFEHGVGVPADAQYASQLYKRACEADVPAACEQLAAMYDQGRGFNVDWGAATKLYAKACDGGNAEGCAELGFRYEKGRGVPPSEARALALYGWACARGSGMGCSNEPRLRARATPASDGDLTRAVVPSVDAAPRKSPAASARRWAPPRPKAPRSPAPAARATKCDSGICGGA